MSSSALSSSAGSLPGFSDADLLLLERTADALTAYSGHPVMAETGSTDGVSWAAFAVPLGKEESLLDDEVIWRMGGEHTRALGNAGGLAPHPDEVFECRLLFVIQVAPEPEARYLKLDSQGEVVAWSESLATLLPFAVSADDDAPWPDETDDEPQPHDPGEPDGAGDPAGTADPRHQKS